MDFLISIIIPVYNCEKYIKRCLESIVNQSYRNLEILLVNDGSTDNSLDQIGYFSDKRIKIYNKTNGGVSSARNLGIEKAIGDYLLFVDADDYINSKMVEELVKEVKEDNTLVFCNNDEIWKNRIDKRVLFKEFKDKINKQDVLREIASGRAGLVCSKLVNRRVIKENNIRFDENLIIGEDQLFFLQVAEKTEQFQYIDKSLYYYDRTNEESATLKYQKNLYRNFSRLQRQVELIFKQNKLNSKEDKRILNNKILNSTWVCINNEVNNLRFAKSINNIYEILILAKRDIDFNLANESKINNLIIKSIKNDSKLETIKIIIFIKLLNVKVNLINKVKVRK